MFSKHVALTASTALTALPPTQHASLSLHVGAAAIESGVNRIQLLPAGYFAAEDGRPGTLQGVAAKQWRLTTEDAYKLLIAMDKSKNDMVFDYEHQTLLAADNGQPAPAAGWCKKLEWVHDVGLFAVDVRWTGKARAMILAGEYKYISPVFEFDKTTGAVTRLINAALTNNPALDGMAPVMAALSKQTALQLSPTDPLDETHDLPKELPMNRLLAALGLAVTATEDTALTALSALQGQATLAAAKDTEIAAKDRELAALKANQFDPTKHIPLVEHNKVAEQLATLKAASDTAEHTALMTAALADCRILPANEAYWRTQPLAVLTAFLKDAKPLVALAGTQTGGKAPAGDGGAGAGASLSAEELAVCKATGISAEDFTNAKATLKGNQS